MRSYNTKYRYFVARTSWFDAHRYDTRQISRIVKENGGENIRTTYNMGWRNQPMVVAFTASQNVVENRIQPALVKELNARFGIICREKDW